LADYFVERIEHLTDNNCNLSNCTVTSEWSQYVC